MSDMDNDYQVQIKPEAAELTKLPETVVVIPIMNSPIFPGMIAPIILSEDKFTPELDQQLLRSGYVALNLVKQDLKNEDGEMIPEEEIDLESREIRTRDIYKVGVLCKVVKKLKLPDGSVNVLVHGVKRYRISEFVKEEPIIEAKFEVFDDIIEADEELDAYTRSVINQVKRLSEINPYFNEEMKLAMLNSPSPGALADLVAFALSLDIPEAQDFLESLVVKKRFGKLLIYLKREKDVADIQKKISDEVNDKVNKYQREYFLREQLKVIRSELGMEEDEKSRDLKIIKEKLAKMEMPEQAKKAALEELERLEAIPDSSPEYNVARTYLNWMVDLPWDTSTEDKIDIPAAKKILEKDHYGLEKAKERILEFLAVRKLKPNYDGTILCLSGPPGVGKTSLGKSIAESLGRKFYRFSLGGMRDEAEIKGHRRTYVGAMPGRIIQALKRVEVNNPVIMLDEIDKLGNSYQGDPASALLEVLDPEQNSTFIDNYLDLPFDLSKVLFIATANYIGEIPEPLLDRMEVLELSGYTIEEKVNIAIKWVIPKQLKKHGLTKSDFSLGAPVLKKLVSDYAREPGVRVMEQMIAKLCRKAALDKVSSKRAKKFVPKLSDLESLLGSARYETEKADKIQRPGVVTGLAWTAYGGDILSIETLPLKGKGGFRLTGQLGDVMNESASLAYSYVRKLLQEELDHLEAKKKSSKKKTGKKVVAPITEETKEVIEEADDFLSTHEVHLHLPAGATPKDGPSAGITMALALYSLATNKRLKAGLAMTGELSLTGKVLPVGGIKEKVLAAKRAGIRTIILPKQNEKDLKEVPERHRKGMKFYPVAHFDEVLKVALGK
ncbi:MAG: endopeptidase La [Bdellovibrionales bacterium CG12_big_fil_rev_8_21_14_0_65_38_15]|nr:MAG: endopeptidase La [Bdellovibrionales bacterium CG22_combo_CG10-13_8_21_14_all_38_13]PIQ57354.1 MAG: endopeptidase La [Bdellovibrionales bacterium CG12_big_fil_rev_8_21_14_0_65_38_15]PIR28899.1 MAG: endopeptidase La [Bdellovibrionales bacterium CG11_big_fil_rev_8_21_14_0_20_38_13]